MSSQASLDVVSGTTIATSWGDAVKAHLLTTETATPATVHEGKEWVRTDTDTLYRYTGSAAEAFDGYGAWTAYTPTLANSSGTACTVGNGTLTGAYRYVAGRTVAFWVRLVLGTTTDWDSSAMAGAKTPALSLPVAMDSSIQTQTENLIHSGIRSTSTGYSSKAVWGSATQLFPYVIQTGGTYGSWVAVDHATPWTWATGGEITFGGVYPSTV